MDPYEVLGVSKDASSDDIRKAYRELAKKYHPDVNPDHKAAEMTAMINAAYDQLMDPGKKSTYDNRIFSAYNESREDFAEEEEDEQHGFAEVETPFKKVQEKSYRVARTLCYPIALFSLLVILDYFLPETTEFDFPVSGYQKTSHGTYSTRVSSFMRTAEYEFEVPNNVHAEYDYKASEKKLIHLQFTPIFNTLKKIGVDHSEYSLMYDAPGSIYSIVLFPIPYLLLGLSVFFIVKKEYTRTRFTYCFLPVITAVIFFTVMLSS